MYKSSILSLAALKKLLTDPNLVILDTTIDKVNQKIDDTNRKLIPNSLFFDIENDFSAHNTGLPHSLVDQETFTTKVQQLGINKDSIIVLYDRWGVYSSPRAWWMFKYFGHKNTFVLNGGIYAWEENNLPLAKEHIKSDFTGNFTATIQPQWLATKELVLAELNNTSTKIIDVRAEGRFTGETPEPRAGIRTGHIPAALNLPFAQVLAGSYMKEAADLKNQLASYITANGLNIFSCGSGITACIVALAAHEAEVPAIAVYDGSWAEWGSDEKLPIEI